MECAEQSTLRDTNAAWERLAHEAWRRGQDALAAGDAAEAIRWLERAARLAPDDDTVRLSLALACQAAGDARALPLFEALAARHEAGAIAAALAVLRLGAGDPGGAAISLGRALDGGVMTDGAAVSAQAIARASGVAGWCGLSAAGFLSVGLVEAAGRPDIALDGKAVGMPPGEFRSPIPLPPRWKRARRLDVSLEGRALIGSPIRLDAVRRVEGFVEDRAEGLAGWAWHPGDPGRDPVLILLAADGRRHRFTARRADVIARVGTVLGRPRGFALPRGRLAGLAAPLRVVGPDGRDLWGSPLLLLADQKPSPPLRSRRLVQGPGGEPSERIADVVIPVCGGRETTLACLRSVMETTAPPSRIIVVDDASADPVLRRALDELAASDRIRLIRHVANRGFPAAANAGMRAAEGRDVVLLNSDTLVPPRWLDQLRDAAASAPDIGTVSPLSNDATILSYPDADRPNPVPDLTETARFAALAYQANGAAAADVPTTVGFCMYIRRECLDSVGELRDDAFAQGYGEENDFCMRARAQGWRHVAATGGFVAHVGGQSFGNARSALSARNQTILARLHPAYERLVREFLAADPLAAARRRLDLARWRDAPGAASSGSVVLITHDSGGGVERSVAAECAVLRGEGVRPIVLRPALTASGQPVTIVGEGVEGGFPNLRFSLPDELPALAALLAEARPLRVIVHHTLGHDPSILHLPARLGLPHEVRVHDYAWFCPRVSLLGAGRRYCGEPDVAGCEACIEKAGRLTGEEIAVAALRERSAALLGGARRVTVPSADCAHRLRRHFSGIDPVVIPPETEPAVPRAFGRAGRARRRIGVVGGIGVEKGCDILLACARDAAARALPLEFVVVGHTADDAALLATGRAFITGPYKPDEAVALIRAQQADLAFLPSIVPETWCYTLTEVWQAGLAVMAFDIGAPAGRIGSTGERGWVLPLGLPEPRINDALLAACRRIAHECAAGIAAV